MATVKTVSVTYERKFNLGDYNSATIGITVWADVDEDENLHDAMTALWSMAKENVKAEAMPLLQKNKARVEEVFLGLPIEVQEAIGGNHAD